MWRRRSQRMHKRPRKSGSLEERGRLPVVVVVYGERRGRGWVKSACLQHAVLTGTETPINANLPLGPHRRFAGARCGKGVFTRICVGEWWCGMEGKVCVKCGRAAQQERPIRSTVQHHKTQANSRAH